MPQLSFHSPVGELTVSEENGVLVAIDWGWACDQEARAQLLSYFDGDRQSFDLPLAPQGTAFQKTVWAAMQDIPYGGVQTYGDIAHKIGSAARAGGMACGANPIPIVIPCHRIVAAASIGGYSGEGGLATKQALLELEGWRDRR